MRTNFAALAGPLARERVRASDAEAISIVRRAARGGPRLDVGETTGVMPAARSELSDVVSREAMARPILEFPSVVRDGRSNASTSSTSGVAVMSTTVTIPDDGLLYDLIVSGHLDFVQFDGVYAAAELRIGPKASGWTGGAGATWRTSPHRLTSTGHVAGDVVIAYWLKTDSGSVTYGAGRIDAYASPQ